jgi:hypothetical protein
MPVWRQACKAWHTGETEIDAFRRLSSLFSDQHGSEAIRITISNLYELGRRIALYWKDGNRKYKVTKRERSSGKLSCPRCKTFLKPRTYKHGARLLQCKACGFCIKPSDLVVE